MSYSSKSDGSPPDVLELALGGAAQIEQDIGRGVEVEVTVRGTIMGHTFTDKHDKNGDLVATVKTLKLKVESADELSVMPPRARGVPTGQVNIDGEVVGDDGRLRPDAPAEESSDVIVEAQVVGELDAGPRPDGVDANGEVQELTEPGNTPRPEPEPGAVAETPAEDTPLADRPPMVPEDSWRQLNREQRADVIENCAQIVKYAGGLAGTENPTDIAWYEERLRVLQAHLLDEYGVTLLADDDIPEPPAAPVGQSVTPDTAGEMSVEALQLRRAFLKAQAGLPPEARDARDNEVDVIDDELNARSLL